QLLHEQIDALIRLKDASTARLERAFAEHIDCCTYRLDAWMLGLVHAQLERMHQMPAPAVKPLGGRGGGRGVLTPPSVGKGLYLGAYAWLESLTPDTRTLEPASIPDPDVASAFAEPGAPQLLKDSENEGFIHAPSLNHAVAAAVLRNGYLANAGKTNAQTMAVNLSSERVRIALGIVEGIRGGQSLGALLGYHFERALHDAHDESDLELDRFIFAMRRDFPLVSNRLYSASLDSRNQTDMSI